jgi:hypothetical protein
MINDCYINTRKNQVWMWQEVSERFTCLVLFSLLVFSKDGHNSAPQPCTPLLGSPCHLEVASISLPAPTKRHSDQKAWQNWHCHCPGNFRSLLGTTSHKNCDFPAATRLKPLRKALDRRCHVVRDLGALSTRHVMEKWILWPQTLKEMPY